MSRLPSMRGGLGRVLALGSLVWTLALAASATLTLDEEVDELLDDALRASAEGLAPLVGSERGTAAAAAPVSPGAARNGELRFAWLRLDAQGRLRSASAGADAELRGHPARLGFASTARWRVYGQALAGGELLVVAQTRAERREAIGEISQMAALASLGVALLGLPLLAWRLQHELQPLQRLSQRLAAFAPEAGRRAPAELMQALGAPERAELEPVHRALQELAQRLDERLRHERAFTAQAAHLLRTPLAGMDAQLAVALRESPGQPRLQRLREATARLQHLVLALLRLFRSEPELQRRALDARELLARLPAPGLSLELEGPPLPLRADPELLAAALLNLIDNAQRHGAQRLWLEPCGGNGLRVCDDGPGLPVAERHSLRQALADPQAPGQGLGLRLAQQVAQAHGGALALPERAQGFAVELDLGRDA